MMFLIKLNNDWQEKTHIPYNTTDKYLSSKGAH